MAERVIVSVYVGVSLVATLPTALYYCHRLRHIVVRRRSRETTLRSGIVRRVDDDLENAARRRIRVSGAIVQLAWALALFGATPKVLSQILGWHEVEHLVGSPNAWLVALPIAGYLFLVAILPTDVYAVRISCILLVTVLLATGGFCVAVAVLGISNAAYAVDTSDLDIVATVAALCFASSLALAPTLRCHGPRAMLPRPALRRLWLVMRLGCFAVGVMVRRSRLEPSTSRPAHPATHASEPRRGTVPGLPGCKRQARR